MYVCIQYIYISYYTYQARRALKVEEEIARVCMCVCVCVYYYTYQARRATMLEEEMARLRDAHAAELDNWRRWQVIRSLLTLSRSLLTLYSVSFDTTC